MPPTLPPHGLSVILYISVPCSQQTIIGLFVYRTNAGATNGGPAWEPGPTTITTRASILCTRPQLSESLAFTVEGVLLSRTEVARSQKAKSGISCAATHPPPGRVTVAVDGSDKSGRNYEDRPDHDMKNQVL